MKNKDFYNSVCSNMRYQNDMVDTNLAINKKTNALKQEDLETKDRVDISLRDYQKMQDTIEKQKTKINIMKDTLSRILGFTENMNDIGGGNFIKQVMCVMKPTVIFTKHCGDYDTYLNLEYRIKTKDIMNYLEGNEIKEIINEIKE